MNNVVSRWIGLFVATVNVDSNKLVIGNYGNTGYYRVNYELATWQKIIQQLKTNHKVILHLQYLFNISFHFALNLVSLWCSTSSKYRINVLSKHKKPQRFFDCINFVCIIAQFCKHVHCDSIPLNNEFGSFIFQPYSSLTVIIKKMCGVLQWKYKSMLYVYRCFLMEIEQALSVMLLNFPGLFYWINKIACACIMMFHYFCQYVMEWIFTLKV